MLGYLSFLQLWTSTRAKLDQSVIGQEQLKTFICDGIRKLVDGYERCVELQEDHAEK